MANQVSFEVGADDPARALAFYGQVFGWRGEQAECPDAWLVDTSTEAGPGATRGLIRRGGPATFVKTLEVGSLEAMAAMVAAHGGQLVVPKMPIPGVGWLAYFRDPEGNVFGLTQPDAEAR